MKITFENVGKRFKTGQGWIDAVKNLSLTVAPGEFFIFLGPSGCGKSTLLNLAAGLETLTLGMIRFGKQVVASAEQKIFLEPARRNVAMVFQSYALYPHMNVFENIAFPLRNQKQKEAEIKKAVRDTAAMLKIGNLLDRKPRALSGGQRQRVAIARALVRRPSVFLLDEPLSNLDVQLRTSTRAELKRLQKEVGVTTLYVTHDQTEAMTLGDRVALLKDGGLVQVGAPQDLYRAPADPFTATFIGSPPMNLIPAKLEPKDGQLGAATADRLIPLGRENQRRSGDFKSRDILLGIRPEHIQIAPEPDLECIRGRIINTEPLGREIIYRIQTAAGEILAVSEKQGLQNGQTVGATFDPAMVHVFEAEKETS